MASVRVVLVRPYYKLWNSDEDVFDSGAITTGDKDVDFRNESRKSQLIDPDEGDEYV
jgi:hypothetical protein